MLLLYVMSDKKKIVETPLMKQYFEVKGKYPDAILLFRVGDFYETFGDDAVIASKVLGIVLTKRANGSASHVELAGFPHHSLETYLPKLVKNGYKVAVCDQLEDPKLTKKIVKRGVTELVTPGVAYNDQILEQKENNFLCSVTFYRDKGGIAFLDISTGTFKIAQGNLEYIDLLISNLKPKEVLLQKGYKEGFKERFGDGFYISTMDEWAFVEDSCKEKLKAHFNTESLKGFGVDSLPLGLTAAGAILYYLEQNQNNGVAQICQLQRIDEGEFVWMDRFTFRNLEIFSSSVGKDGVCLLDVIDKCCSPLGARMLRSWLAMPLKDIDKINNRHNCVDFFVKNPIICTEIKEHLSNVGDLERITAKAAAGKILPREIMMLKRGLEQIVPISNLSKDIESNLNGKLIFLDSLLDKINTTMSIDPAAALGKGDVIADGVNEELDKLREIARHGKDYLMNLQHQESVRTGIPSLKISYNNVFGYYLEVRNTHKDKVPAEWIRKQTLVSAERYITPELKEYEEKILGAEDKILQLEQRIYTSLVFDVQKEIPSIKHNCDIIAHIDCFVGFAELAIVNKYCRPVMDEGQVMDIKEGRHPVIETLMGHGEQYIANDLFLDNNSQQIIILTGPNMSGKSALLRQTALIVLLAQIGSFVPAKSALIPITDKIFTRVGASDNISKGESTFMVEMTETATILHNLSQRSLVLLDEIGRGTSTFDGMSIAWAIVEYLHQSSMKAKTLFATHYHELNELEEIYPRVKNYHISIKEVGNKVIFLRKLVPGGVEHSFGIHVARMAGMPQWVINAAEKTLNKLESKKDDGKSDSKKKKGAMEDNLQLSFFQLDDPLLVDIKDKLKAMDINTMSPLDAFDALRALKKQIGL